MILSICAANLPALFCSCMECRLCGPQNCAAEKIQAGFRGKKGREKAKLVKAQKVAEAKREKEENAAAAKIQAGFRGKQGRDKAKTKRAERAAAKAKIKADEHVAASKIQAGFRGKKGRDRAKAKRAEREAVVKEAGGPGLDGERIVGRTLSDGYIDNTDSLAPNVNQAPNEDATLPPALAPRAGAPNAKPLPRDDAFFQKRIPQGILPPCSEETYLDLDQCQIGLDEIPDNCVVLNR